MRPRLALSLVAVPLGIALVAFWQLREPPAREAGKVPSELPGLRKPTPASASPVAIGKDGQPSGAPPISEVEWKKLLGMISNGGGYPEIKLTEADMERFLAAKGHTPANYLAAWFCTRKLAWLDRALERFPNHPMVLFAKIGAGDTKNPDLELVRRFNEAAPDNPLPKFMEASALFTAGNKEAAVAAIREALARPGLYIWMKESTDATRSLHEFSGMSPLLADVVSTVQMPLPHLSTVMAVSRGLTDAYKQGAEAGQADPALIEATYRMGLMFETPEAARMLIGQLVGKSIQMRALQSLPADAAPAWLSARPAERLAQLEAEKANIPKLTESTNWLYQPENAHLLGPYLQRVRTEGEMAAMNWLNQKRNER
jgi:hypothetical protein